MLEAASPSQKSTDWSQIPYGETLVIFCTDWLLNKSMTVAIEIKLSRQFVLFAALGKGRQHKS